MKDSSSSRDHDHTASAKPQRDGERHIDKSSWGDGPWQTEPDRKEWVDPATGLRCLILRTDVSGALCGYVGVPPGHPAHGLNYDAYRYGEDGAAHPLTTAEEQINAIEAHGGLTYAGEGDGDYRPAGVWWFGFDCSHAGDYSPAMDSRWWRRGLGAPTGWGGVITYHDIAYVEAQTTRLAEQLAAIAKATGTPTAQPPPDRQVAGDETREDHHG